MAYEKTQSACGLCAFFLRHIFAVAGNLTVSFIATAKTSYTAGTLRKITADDIENWFDMMAEKDYQNTYTNGIFGTLKTMMIEAAARKLIPATLTANMEKLVNDRREIKIPTRAEFKALFIDEKNH